MQSVDEIYALLRTAGTRKQPVAAMYEGHPRFFCPHVLGKSKRGRRQALCYQFGGTSDSGLRTVAEVVGGWRCIVVEKLSAVELQSGIWHTEPRSNPPLCAKISETPSRPAFNVEGGEGNTHEDEVKRYYTNSPRFGFAGQGAE